MKRISKRRITQEIAFESDDGNIFPYEGLALEHDITSAETAIRDLKRGDINIPDLNLVGSIYKATKDNELDKIKRYVEALDLTFEQDGLPALIIVTDKFAVSVDKLKELSESISEL